jgi:hypothetical protein
MASVASISRARGWAVRTAAPLRGGESRADSSRRGLRLHSSDNSARVIVAAEGDVEHVVLGSQGDNV